MQRVNNRRDNDVQVNGRRLRKLWIPGFTVRTPLLHHKLNTERWWQISSYMKLWWTISSYATPRTPIRTYLQKGWIDL